MSHNVYQSITDTIIGQLSTVDPASWECPWHRGSLLPINASTSRAYRGINILTLWATSMCVGYTDHRWATYKQWSDLGAQVRKGERGSPCVFYKALEKDGGNGPASSRDDASTSSGSRFVLRFSTLFNADQVEGAAKLEPTPGPATTIEACQSFDDFVYCTGANVVQRGSAACFSPSSDEIHMPDRGLFRSTAGYVTTLSHELTHWTGVKHRLDRDLAGRFGSESYAAEELVAELGSAFLPASLGLASEPPPNHAAYIANWLPLVKSDPRVLFTAAAHASRAVDWLLATAAYAPFPAAPALAA